MEVRDAMSSDVVSIEPDRTLRDAAELMTSRNIGAAVIVDPEQPAPGIVTERDLVRSLGSGEDPDGEKVSDHLTAKARFADAAWSLEKAAQEMVSGGFRHLVVVEDGEPVGVLSMRDILRTWAEER